MKVAFPKAQVRKSYHLCLEIISIKSLEEIAKKENIAVEQVMETLILKALQVFKNPPKDRSAYMKRYYKNNPEKFGQKPKKQERRQDRIDKTFREEDARLSKIQYLYCVNRACPKPNRKYVKGTGVRVDYRGLTLYSCSSRCKEMFLESNNNNVQP